MTERILFVDDDQSILAGFQRVLRKRFEMDVALGGEPGIAAMEKCPYAVVVADMRMPGMDGIRFMATAKERWPETVRVMLTGVNDITATLIAVNAGNLFRFLTKPCSGEDLATTLDAALIQHKLLTAEKELLEKTLSIIVRVLTETLSLVSPKAFGRALRAKHFASFLAEQADLDDRWQVPLATLLSQLGCLTLPSDVLDRMVAGQMLDGSEKELASGHYQVACTLINHIPRMGVIARLIELQPAMASSAPFPSDRNIKAAQIIHLALELDVLLSKGVQASAAIGQLRQRLGPRYSSLCDSLGNFQFKAPDQGVRVINSNEMVVGMIFDEDVRTKKNLLLVSKGQEVTQPVIECLRGHAKHVGITEPFRVLA